MKKAIKMPRISADLKKRLASLIGIISPSVKLILSFFIVIDSGKNNDTKIIERMLTPAAKKKGAEKLIATNKNPLIIGPKINPAPKTALE